MLTSCDNFIYLMQAVVFMSESMCCFIKLSYFCDTNTLLYSASSTQATQTSSYIDVNKFVVSTDRQLLVVVHCSIAISENRNCNSDGKEHVIMPAYSQHAWSVRVSRSACIVYLHFFYVINYRCFHRVDFTLWNTISTRSDGAKFYLFVIQSVRFAIILRTVTIGASVCFLRHSVNVYTVIELCFRTFIKSTVYMLLVEIWKYTAA